MANLIVILALGAAGSVLSALLLAWCSDHVIPPLVRFLARPLDAERDDEGSR